MTSSSIACKKRIASVDMELAIDAIIQSHAGIEQRVLNLGCEATIMSFIIEDARMRTQSNEGPGS
jgi:hypothetical protein